MLLGFIGYMLFGFAMSGFGSQESNPYYLLLSSIPVITIGFVTYKLHSIKHRLNREGMKESVRQELTNQQTTLSPERTVLTAMEHAGQLSLDELSARTSIPAQELLTVLGQLELNGQVERSSSMDGISFKRRDISEV